MPDEPDFAFQLTVTGTATVVPTFLPAPTNEETDDGAV